MRISSLTRGVFIGALIVAYGWFVRLPEASFTQMFIVGVALQVLVVLLRRFVPAARQPQAHFAFEMIADAATVLMFVLGVFGGIMRAVSDV
jgi:hypothetical protein